MGAETAEVRFGPRTFRFGERTYVMGVLNVTRDSFSDGGRYFNPEKAAERARQMVAEGADIIDVGAESASLRAEKIDAAEELRRLLPVLEAIRPLGVAISVDTYKAEVAEAALRAGAHIVNDISGLHEDPEMPAVVARHGAGVVVMHLQGRARRVTDSPSYRDVLAEVKAYWQEGVDRALAAGVQRDRIIVDPGIGVGKLTEHNLALLAGLRELRAFGYPLLLGASRTSAVGNLLEAPVDDRLEGTLATTVAGAALGADIVRVHDVWPNVRAARIADAMLRGRWQEPEDGWPFDAVTGQQRRALRPVGPRAATPTAPPG